MAERATSEAQLARILDLLPRAAREGGASLSELAQALDTDERSIIRDIEEVYTRAYYHPAGSGEDVQILIESDRVAVWTTGEFRRPLRLSPVETLALALGLRVLGADSPAAERARCTALADRLEASVSIESSGDRSSRFAVASAPEPAEGIRAAVTSAARERRRCRIEYLKPGAPHPEPREVDPYAVLVADGRWYLVGHCHRSAEPRVFRLDRITAIAVLEQAFTVPGDFRPESFVEGGRVYRGGQDVEVEVRYSARIARWIEEQGPVTRLDDGGVLVRYRVGDPSWIVKLVLQHGADAEVVGPPEMRRHVRDAVGRILRTG